MWHLGTALRIGKLFFGRGWGRLALVIIFAGSSVSFLRCCRFEMSEGKRNTHRIVRGIQRTEATNSHLYVQSFQVCLQLRDAAGRLQPYCHCQGITHAIALLLDKPTPQPCMCIHLLVLHVWFKPEDLFISLSSTPPLPPPHPTPRRFFVCRRAQPATPSALAVAWQRRPAGECAWSCCKRQA